MKREKNKIIIEYIENTINTTSLYTDRIYRWMNREGRALFDMESVKKEFCKNGKFYPVKKKEKEEPSFDFDNEEDSEFIIPDIEYKDMILCACQKEKSAEKIDIQFEQRLIWLKEILGLNDCEYAILKLYAYIRRSRILSAFLSDVFPCNRGYRNDFHIQEYPELIKENENNIGQALSFDGRLVRSGIFSTEEREYGLSNNVYEILEIPLKSKEKMKKFLIGEKQKATISFDDFQFLGKEPDLLKKLLNNAIRTKQKGINVLLYGKPGTGKTEFAKTLCASINKDLYSVCEGKNSSEEPSRQERLNSLKTSDFILAKSTGILLFDEAEDVFDFDLFSPRKKSKVFMNRLLEDNIHPIIWTTNNIRSMDDAYIRRFTRLVCFENPDEDFRKNIWKKTANENKLDLSEKDACSLASKYQAPPAIISSAVKGAKLMKGGIREIEDSLDMYAKAMGEKYINDNQASAFFNPALLNTDTDMETLANRLCKSDSKAFSLCLYGASGTGKSAYARYIAQKFGMKVIQKRASDLLDKFVGESEKLIANAFEEAKQKESMLIFDEADSLLRDRKYASYSWQVSQVNEMLTWMERHPLPFVCTTNLMDDLDKASLRRFTFKIKYDYLNAEQVIQSFAHFFGVAVDEKDISHLTCLAPGDFVVVKKKADILGCLDNKKELTHMLSEEMSVKKEVAKPFKIGFV